MSKFLGLTPKTSASSTRPTELRREDREGEDAGFDTVDAKRRKKRRGKSSSVLSEAAGKTALGG